MRRCHNDINMVTHGIMFRDILCMIATRLKYDEGRNNTDNSAPCPRELTIGAMLRKKRG